MRPAVAAADHILDIHSTSQDVLPFWVYPRFRAQCGGRARPAAAGVHLVMPAGLGSGTPLIQHGATAPGATLPARPSSSSAASTSSRPAPTWRRRSPWISSATSASSSATSRRRRTRRFELLRTHVVQDPGLRLHATGDRLRDLRPDELIATDGSLEIRAPCDDCTIFMPARTAIVGREGVYLTRPLH
jgi:hypothetical protein